MEILHGRRRDEPQTTDRMKGVFAGARTVFDKLNRKVTQYEAGKEVAPGITSVATPGHTPGHMSYVVASGNAKVYVQADVTNHPALFARNPGWHAFFDQDPQMAEATRRKVYDMLVAEKMMVQGFHYPFPALAYIEKAGSGYREIPVMWNAHALARTIRDRLKAASDGGLLSFAPGTPPRRIDLTSRQPPWRIAATTRRDFWGGMR